MKAFIKSMIAAALFSSCTIAATAPAHHRCGVLIERATPDELLLELRSTSQSTAYSVDVNYSRVPCEPWDGHEESWVIRKELTPGLYALSWAKFYDENPRPGMEACINWTCQPEVAMIYWGQDYRAVLDYWYLPSVSRNES